MLIPNMRASSGREFQQQYEDDLAKKRQESGQSRTRIQPSAFARFEIAASLPSIIVRAHTQMRSATSTTTITLKARTNNCPVMVGDWNSCRSGMFQTAVVATVAAPKMATRIPLFRTGRYSPAPSGSVALV